MKRVVVTLAFALLGGACSSASGIFDPGTDTVCTLEARPGIALTAFDSVSGQGLSTVGTVIAQDGSHSDTAFASPGTPVRYSMAYERPGRYTVTVSMDGYRAWKADSIFVTRDACHVVTVQLNARLVR